MSPLVSWRKLEFDLDMSRRKLTDLADRAKSYYRPFDVAKKDGNWRHIDNPVGELKTAQARIHGALLRGIELPDNMVGGVAKRSVKQNALVHVGQPTLVKLDLRNHFGRITHGQVFEALRRELGVSPTLAHILTKVATVHGRLPQGAPTSSMLANLVMLPVHREISAIAASAGCKYTLFVDDLTLSGVAARSIVQDVIRALQRGGFAVVARKLEIMDSWERQQTTGLVVNTNLSLPRSLREDIRKRIFSGQRLGHVSESEYSSIYGRIGYLAHIDPTRGAEMAGLAEAKLPLPTPGFLGSERATRRPCSNAARHGLL